MIGTLPMFQLFDRVPLFSPSSLLHATPEPQIKGNHVLSEAISPQHGDHVHRVLFTTGQKERREGKSRLRGGISYQQSYSGRRESRDRLLSFLRF